ncbi:MAG TPA: SRPBCC family protein [Cyclobacteriaceae bacterium]|nr:SRPBCC family protein [Cyclobacteriaceae bacterium]
MKVFLTIVFVVVIVVIVAVFVGRSLPVKHTASISASFTSSPEEVWKVVVNVSELKSWRKDVKDVTITGLDTFKETGSNGEIEYRVSNSVKGVSHVATIITKDIPFGGEWTYAFAKEGSGCKLTITENGEVYNPLFRFMSKYIFGHDGTLKAYMKDLQARIK